MTPRPLSALAALILLPLLAGALVAPVAHGHVVPALDRLMPGGSFAAPEFTRVVTRCVMLVALVSLPWIVRLSGLRPELASALRPDRHRARALAGAIAVGVTSLLAAYGTGYLLAGYRLSDDIHGTGHLVSRAALFLGTAVFVGLFEETLFRGFLHGALRSRLSFWPAAVAGSLFFAILHFMHPPLPVGFDPDRWYAGLALLPHLFGEFQPDRDGAFFCTLFLMGLALCARRERDGHLWYAIGLHGGWVWALQLGAFVLDRNWAFLRGPLGGSDYIAQGAIAVPILLLFLLWNLRPTANRALR